MKLCSGEIFLRLKAPYRLFIRLIPRFNEKTYLLIVILVISLREKLEDWLQAARLGKRECITACA